MKQDCWKINEAKAHFANVLSATGDGPQIILNRQEPVAVIIKYQDYLESNQRRDTATQCIDEILNISKESPIELSIPPRNDRDEEIF